MRKPCGDLRIPDFFFPQAIELGDAAFAEAEAAKATLEKKAELTLNLPDPSQMDTAPEELAAPASLGGTLLDVEITEKDGPDITLTSLGDRASDEKEDMNERNEWQRAVNESESAEEEPVEEEPVEEELVEEELVEEEEVEPAEVSEAETEE